MEKDDTGKDFGKILRFAAKPKPEQPLTEQQVQEDEASVLRLYFNALIDQNLIDLSHRDQALARQCVATISGLPNQVFTGQDPVTVDRNLETIQRINEQHRESLENVRRSLAHIRFSMQSNEDRILFGETVGFDFAEWRN